MTTATLYAEYRRDGVGEPISSTTRALANDLRHPGTTVQRSVQWTCHSPTLVG